MAVERPAGTPPLQGSHVTLSVDGRPVTVPKGTTVWHAARQAGIDIPIFCYQDRMPPLGACRQCLVAVEKMPKLQTSCTLVAEEGMIVHATSPEARAGQEAILELLLINHPLDCPICDKGGECPLQDQAYTYGPERSRFVEVKRDFAKPVSLGPVLVLDRERCVMCWRCVRFGEIVAGDHALKGFDRGFATEIDTPDSQPVVSKFIGNTIALCPVGALTSRAYRFVSRPWDNTPVPSACEHCGLGCATWMDVRGNEIVRVRARETPDLNDIWLCDLGQFGYEYVAAPDRLTRPLVRRDGALAETSWSEALDLIAEQLEAVRRRDPARVAALGGSRLINEECYLMRRFFREVVGTPHLDFRVDAPPASAALDVPWGLRTPLQALDQSDLFLLVGCDLTEEYPIAWLRMKRALDLGAQLFIIHPRTLEIAAYAAGELTHRPGEEGAVLAQILAGVAKTGRVRPAAKRAARSEGDAGAPTRVAPDAITALVAALRAATHPVALIGGSALDGPAGTAVLHAATELVQRGVTVHVMRGKSNAFGAQRMGVLPGPGGWTAPEIIRQAGAGALDVLYVLGADPASEIADRGAWETARNATPFLVVHDLFLTDSAQRADVVLPVLAWAEKDGTVTNIEGRIQALRAGVRGPGDARADGEVLRLLASRLGTELAHGGWEEIFGAAAAEDPELRVGAVLPAPPLMGTWAADGPPPGSSGELVLVTGDVLFGRGSLTSRAPRIAELAGVPAIDVHPDDAGRVGVTDGGLVEVSTGKGRLIVRARVSRRVLPGQVFLPRAFEAAAVNRLLSWDTPIPAVTLRPRPTPGDRTTAGEGTGA